MAITARCMKCKKQVNMVSPKQVTIKKGTFAAKGTCGKCGGNVYRILGKKPLSAFK